MFLRMLSLAFKHHLAIAKNIPLDQVIEWLIKTAPKGLIEFVPKNDGTINNVKFKGDIFKDYNEKILKIYCLKMQKYLRLMLAKVAEKSLKYLKLEKIWWAL